MKGVIIDEMGFYFFVSFGYVRVILFFLPICGLMIAFELMGVEISLCVLCFNV